VVDLGDDFINEAEKILNVNEQQPSAGTKITDGANKGFEFPAFRMELSIRLRTI
jgi:hypothetical protein